MSQKRGVISFQDASFRSAFRNKTPNLKAYIFSNSYSVASQGISNRGLFLPNLKNILPQIKYKMNAF